MAMMRGTEAANRVESVSLFISVSELGVKDVVQDELVLQLGVALVPLEQVTDTLTFEGHCGEDVHLSADVEEFVLGHLMLGWAAMSAILRLHGFGSV